MKKFAKICLITAGVMLLIGFFMVLIAGIAGGRTGFHEIRNSYLETKLERLGWEWDNGNFHFVWDDDSIDDSIDDGNIPSSEESFHENERTGSNTDRSRTLTVNGKKADTAGAQYEIETAGIKKLDFMMGSGEFILTEKEADDGKISLYIEGKGNCSYYVEENTLHIEGFKGVQEFKNVGEWNRMEIQVPKGSFFHEIDMEIGAGQMDIYDINVEEFEAEIGAGKVNISNMTATEFEAQIGIGSLIADNVQAVNADMLVNMGNIDFYGGVSGALDVENSMGSVGMTLDGSAEDHNYVIECAMGSIKIKDFLTTAISEERTIYKGKNSTYNISCDMGNIEIDFRD